MRKTPGPTTHAISDDIRCEVARELAESHGAFAFDHAWGIADTMRMAGCMVGYRMWCSIAGKVVAMHILSGK